MVRVALVAVTLALSARKTARRYFDIWYRPEHRAGFCRAHLVGEAYRLDDRALYLVEVRPGDAAKAHAWTVPETGLRGAYLLERGRFYKLAFEEELYD